MAVLLNSMVSPMANPPSSSENSRKPWAGYLYHSQNVYHLSFNYNNKISLFKVWAYAQMSSSTGLSSKDKDDHAPIFTLPNWRTTKNDPRTKDHQLNDAFLYLEYMVGKGKKPDMSQTTQLLYDLCKINKLRKATRVMEMMVISGSTPDPATYTFLVDHLCKRGNVGHAMQLVEKMEECGYQANSVTYNSLLKGLCMKGNLKQSLQFLERLMQKGLVIPNAFTYSFLLEAAYKEKGVDEAMRLLDEIITAKSGHPSANLVSYNVILTGLCKEGRIDEAIMLLRNLPSKGFSPNVVSYNIMLRSLGYEGRWDEVSKLLAEMISVGGEDSSPSTVTYNILIGALSFHGRTDEALQLLEEMFNGPFKPTASTFNPIVASLCRKGDVDAVVKCLDQMMYRRNCNPNDGTYNAISLLCSREAGKVKEAFIIIQSLISGKQQKTISHHDFYRNVVSSLCRKGNTYAGFKLLYEMTTRSVFMPDTFTYSSLIRGLCMEGMLDGAIQVLHIMMMGEEEENAAAIASALKGPDTDNFNALVLGLCKYGRTDLAIEIYEEMIEKGYMPNETTYTILVEGMAHEGEKGLASAVLRELYWKKVVSRNTMERLVMQYQLQQ